MRPQDPYNTRISPGADVPTWQLPLSAPEVERWMADARANNAYLKSDDVAVLEEGMTQTTAEIARLEGRMREVEAIRLAQYPSQSHSTGNGSVDQIRKTERYVAGLKNRISSAQSVKRELLLAAEWEKRRSFLPSVHATPRWKHPCANRIEELLKGRSWSSIGTRIPAA